MGVLGWPCHNCRRRDAGAALPMIEAAVVVLGWEEERSEGATATCVNQVAGELFDASVA